MSKNPAANSKRQRRSSAPARETAKPAAGQNATLTRTLRAGQTPEHATAEAIVDGVVGHTATVRHWTVGGASGWRDDQIDITSLYNAMERLASDVKAGDLSAGEALLMSQAESLNAIFVFLAHRARNCQTVPQFETNLRYALRAQNQCRATLETLSVMKNPPVFATQANIAQGPQQVNNGPVVNGPGDSVSTSRGRADAAISEPNKLLEAHVERMDGRAALKTGAGDSSVEAVGKVHGASHSGGEGAHVTERLPRRRTATAARIRP